jgi:excisionase family DNA binding protein
MESNVSEKGSENISELQGKILDRLTNKINQLPEDRRQLIMSDLKEIYSVEDVAKFFNCHVETIRKAIRSGDLIAAKIGKSYKISRIDLNNYYVKQGGSGLFED